MFDPESRACTCSDVAGDDPACTIHASQDRNVQADQQGWAETPEASVALEGGSASAGASPPSSSAASIDPERSRRWRSEVIPPEVMTTEDIRAELGHDLRVYGQVQHPLSKAGLARRITVLVEEMDRRVAADRQASSAATVDVEFMLMVDYLGKSGIWGSESRFYRNRSESAVLDEAQRTLAHARRVEVFRREVTVPWEKVEEFNG